MNWQNDINSQKYHETVKLFYFSKQDSGRSELMLSDVIPSDAGDVICMATNAAGQVNFTAVLEIKCKIKHGLSYNGGQKLK